MTSGFGNLGIGAAEAVKILLMILLLAVFDYISLKKDVIACIGKWKLLCRWAVYLGILALIFFWAPAESAQFIYFDF